MPRVEFPVDEDNYLGMLSSVSVDSDPTEILNMENYNKGGVDHILKLDRNKKRGTRSLSKTKTKAKKSKSPDADQILESSLI